MSNFPRFNQNTDWREVSAVQMNALVEAVKRHDAILTRSGGGAVPGLNYVPPFRAVVVLEPQEGDESLLVRRVTWASGIPDPKADPPYLWWGEPEVAYIDYGTVIEDYIGIAWDSIEGPPTKDAVFVKVYTEGRTLRVERPDLGLIKYALVRNVPDIEGKFVLVQLIRRTQQGEHVTYGEVFPADVHPSMKGGDYDPLVIPGGDEGQTVTRGMCPVELHAVDGVWHVHPYTKVGRVRVNSQGSYQYSDATPLRAAR